MKHTPVSGYVHPRDVAITVVHCSIQAFAAEKFNSVKLNTISIKLDELANFRLQVDLFPQLFKTPSPVSRWLE
jgi:hypothetical protein